jgi:hypothetical protein
MEQMRNAYQILVGNPEGKRVLGRPGRIWEDTVKLNLKEEGRMYAAFDLLSSESSEDI